MAPEHEPRYKFGEPDRWALDRGHRLVAGVDEVGRGAMAGPLVAAAAILEPEVELALVNDSKLLTPEQRDEAYEEIREVATKGLSDKERRVVAMYYFDGLTMKEVGSILGISESRVCQIHSQVMKLLRERYNKQSIAA